VTALLLGAYSFQFSNLLTKAGLEVTDENREKIDDIIHKFIVEKSATVTVPLTGRKLERKSKLTKG